MLASWGSIAPHQSPAEARRDARHCYHAINYDYNENLWLEQQLKQKFGLKEAVVASSDGLLEEEQLSAMGQHGALLVDRLLEPGDIIGFSWGRAVRSLVENLPQASHSRQVICVPIIGGPSGKLESRYHVNTLTYGAAARLKAESHLADFPALLDNPLIRNGIMQSQHFKTISSYWDSLDVALVGIGSPAIRDGANWHAFYGSEESDDLNARHVAGDICSRFYDINGGLVDTNMSEKPCRSKWRSCARLAIPSASPWGKRNTLAFLAHCMDAILIVW